MIDAAVDPRSLHHSLSNPVLDSPTLTLSERFHAYQERYDLRWRLIGAVALAALTSFGLWYAGYCVAAAIVSAPAVAGALYQGHRAWAENRKHFFSPDLDWHHLIGSKKYYLIKWLLQGKTDRSSIHVPLGPRWPQRASIGAFHQHDVVALYLVLQHPECPEFINGPDANQMPMLHRWVVGKFNELEHQEIQKAGIQLLLKKGANPNILYQGLGVGMAPPPAKSAIEMAQDNLKLADRLWQEVAAAGLNWKPTPPHPLPSQT